MPIKTVDEKIKKYGSIAVLRAEQYGQRIEFSFEEMLNQTSNVIFNGDSGKFMLIKIIPGIHLDSVFGQAAPANPGKRSAVVGPRRKRIMFVGCWPNFKEDSNARLYMGDWVAEFEDLVKKTSFPVNDCYYTTYVKQYVDGKKTSIPKELVQEYAPLFKRELETVNPDLVILLGAKTLKAVLGAKATVDKYKNRTMSAEESPLGIKTAIMTDFSAIMHMPEVRGAIAMDMSRIANELANNKVTVEDDTRIDYHCVFSPDQLERYLDRIEQEYSEWVAVDCEWGGGNHLSGSLRCLQFSWAPGKVLVIVFNFANLQPTDIGQNPQQAWQLIKKFVENGKTRLIGHFIRADLPWLKHNGINITVPVLRGWDTALAGHLLDENWDQGLEIYTARHTQMGRYELELTNWIKANKYDVDELGYGGIPDDILLPYAAKDADATFRIFLIQYQEMMKPENEKIKDLFENVVMPTTLPILEIEMTGMNVDRERLELLSHKYTYKRTELAESLRAMLSWPDFNPDSPVQKAAALFGWVKQGSKPSFPNTATLAKFEPIKATNDKKWADLIKTPDKMASYTPSTDRSVLTGLLLQHKDNQLLNTMLLYTAVAQTVKTFTGEFGDDPVTGGHKVEGGILPKLWSDGRVHTRIRQTVETGRYGHSDPNMAQLPKTAEDLVSKAFKDTNQQIPPIRSCFRADPGWVLLDCDWVQAELFVMAWLSGDTNMQQKLGDPGSDFHSEVAIEMFRLDQPPVDYPKGKKDWLKESGNIKYRTIAKTITFGIAYGRGAAAIKEAVYAEGINITLEEAQQSVDKFKETFPQLAHWLISQQEKVSSQAYVENGFGRRRRFEHTEDNELLAHQKRQAMNAPIQGTVGDLMSLALVNLYMIREVERPHLQYRVVMSVHDQIIVTCPVEQVDETLEVMRLAMCEKCTIPGSDLVLGIDSEVCIRWSEPLTSGDVAQYPVLAKHMK
jgi:uracil-DNA glycosylase family 4